LAAEFEDGDRTAGDFVADLERRVRADDTRGVHLLTYHRAKGLEFDAVFLPRVEEQELPIRQSTGDDAALAEERRLLYVGMTRAKRHLTITWAGKPSRFLRELGATASERRAAPVEDGLPAYVVFHDRTLAEIAARRPGTADELAEIPGVGPAKLERYAGEVLAALARDQTPTGR
jgi:DNA helicase-2/ATP-dependent DNA helicase PcrA